jgi:pimeloyl-ACP methyl ester carboxylesterase
MLPKVKLQTLIVRGDDDNIMPLECATLYQKAIPGSTLKVIDKCGYWAQFERPQELAQLVSEFFA